MNDSPYHQAHAAAFQAAARLPDATLLALRAAVDFSLRYGLAEPTKRLKSSAASKALGTQPKTLSQ
jgi:hypothetical protein